MARQDRVTLPQVTNLGKIDSYNELKGRFWVFEQTLDEAKLSNCPTDNDIYDLHHAMFNALYSWAGKPRMEDRGPGGICHVPWVQVRLELRQKFQNSGTRFSSLKLGGDAEIEVETVAEIVAQAHHDFQFVHQFADTNGRTGRVLDHYLLWVTFGLVGEGIKTSPLIQHFPTPKHEDEY